jgi:quercetin dioxygenase-like cupin family protein
MHMFNANASPGNWYRKSDALCMKERSRTPSKANSLGEPEASLRPILHVGDLKRSASRYVHRNSTSNKRGENFMIKQTTRILAVLSVILLLQAGCAAVRITPEAREGAPVVKELIKTTQSWAGVFLPAYPQGQPEITILRITIPAGTRLDTHTHPVINAGVLISGQLTVVTTEGKTLHLQAGDPIVEVVNALHYGINQGKVPAEIVVFYAGVIDTPITVVKPR